MRLRASGRGCRLGLAFAFLAVLPPPAEAGTELVLPGVARSSGVGGSRFVSTLWVHNPATTAVDVDLALVTPEGTRGPVRLTVGPRQTRRVDDPVSSLFSLEAAAGTLTARAEASFLLRGVTANVADPRGTYGLALESLRADAALKPGETGIAPGLSHTAATGTLFRTNVAVTLLEKGSEAMVTVVDDSGLVRGEERVTGGPLFWQRPVSDLSPDPEVPLGRVGVRVLSGSAVAYAAVVDNGTGDGIVSPARRVEAPSGPPYALLLPGAARSAGANGTLWRTSLRLANPGLASVDVALEGPAGSRVTRVVPPRGLLEETDLLGALGQPEGSAGAVTVTSATRLCVLASTRNVDPSGQPGTFAAGQEPVPADGLAAAGSVVAFSGLSAEAGAKGFRTNVTFVAGGGGARGRLLLRSAAGEQAASGAFDLGSGAWVQKPLADWLGGAAVPKDATLEIAVEAGGLAAYASVIDNGTGDPVLLAPELVSSSTCSGTVPLLSATASRVTAGGAVSFRLEGGRSGGRLVPGDLPLGPSGTVSVVPAVSTTYRWLPSSGCPGEVPASVTVEVTAPAGAVMTESGALAGVTGGASAAWKGIPLAAPPVGALRWRPPAPPAPWTGVRDASAFGPICPQLDDAGTVTGAEDCLFLNVFAPAAPPATPLPVLFFIHGGGNHFGEGSLPVYDGSVFAAEGRAVVVTVNYRLSSFGWLSQPFLSAETRRGVSGSYGTFDQLAALRWVRRNIAAFGGDPSRVTIFGESAGGANVCTLVASPLARSLFSAGIVESGGCVRRQLSDFTAFGSTVTEKAGCASAADPAACLRALPFETILLAVPPSSSLTSSTGQLWGPAVDGFVLRDSPDAAMAKGEHNRVTFVIGANADETGADAPSLATEAEYRALVTAQFGGLAPLVLAKYPASADPTPRRAYVAVTTDARFVGPSRQHARAAAQGGSKVFRYFFSYPANRVFGAIHAVELPYVFGSLRSVPGFTPDAKDLALSASMNRAWARVAATADPNGPGLPAWPAYDPVRDTTLVWDSPVGTVDGVRTSACDFWDTLTTPR